jgi:DNA-binding response OmpR family regulator
MHALIIHEQPFREAIRGTLAEIGYSSFDVVSTAAAARVAARRRRPDLIVTACTLPDGDVRDAIDGICGAGECPVVFVTVETDALLNWLASAIVVTSPFERLALELAVEEAIVRPFAGNPSRRRPIGGSAAIIYG